MNELARHIELRSPLLWAVYFTGLALILAAGKGHLGEWANWFGNVLMFGSIGAFIVRAWYLSRSG